MGRMKDIAIEVFNAKVEKLQAKLALHHEARCDCHQQQLCTCNEEFMPIGIDKLRAENWHCMPEFLISCELEGLPMT